MTTTLGSRFSKSRIFTRRTMFLTLAAFALLAVTSATALMAQLNGAIFTTDSGCGPNRICDGPRTVGIRRL